MTPAEIRALDDQVRARFTYRRDPAGQDQWRSHADEVLAGRRWTDDCDGLASTFLDLAMRQGLPGDRAFRLFVDSSGVGRVDHMLACVIDDDGGYWLAGDTFGQACPAGEFRHQAVEYQRMDEWWPGTLPKMRQGLPWQAV